MRAGDSLSKIARVLESAGIIRDARALVGPPRGGALRPVRAASTRSPVVGTVRVPISSFGSYHLLGRAAEGRTRRRSRRASRHSGGACGQLSRSHATERATSRCRGPASSATASRKYRMPPSPGAPVVERWSKIPRRWRPLEAAARARGFGMRQTVPRASIVERTVVAAERPLVASVSGTGSRADAPRIRSTAIYGSPNSTAT